MQEAAVSGYVVVRCGSQDLGIPRITYRDISTTCAFLRKVGWSEKLQYEHVGGRDVLFFPTAVVGTQVDWFRRSIERRLLVYEMRSFEASDPRDMVFGLLGLLNDHSHRRLHTLRSPSHEQSDGGHHGIRYPHMQERYKSMQSPSGSSTAAYIRCGMPQIRVSVD